MGLFSALFDLKGCARRAPVCGNGAGCGLSAPSEEAPRGFFEYVGQRRAALSWRAFSNQIFLKAMA